MKVAFIIYNGVTLLDFAGMYDPVTRLNTMGLVKNLTCDVCAINEKIVSQEGLTITPNKIKNDLAEYDYILIPGGNGIKELLSNNEFFSWLAKFNKGARLVSVCGGSIILGLLGVLKDRVATTHPTLVEYLKKFAKEVSSKRIVEDGNIITARGVSSSLDLGLYLCEKIAGKEIRKKIQDQMDYQNYVLN
jgi:transcriptional regulator GlxA family with amidase domain